jgi:hypothetical protein
MCTHPLNPREVRREAAYERSYGGFGGVGPGAATAKISRSSSTRWSPPLQRA